MLIGMIMAVRAQRDEQAGAFAVLHLCCQGACGNTSLMKTAISFR
jgi:NADH:ubiquinone oxidoreductase subunit E